MKCLIYRQKKVSHKINDLLNSIDIGIWWCQEFVDGWFNFAACLCHSLLWVQLLDTALRNWANHPAKGCLTQCRSKRMLGDRKIWQLKIRRNRPAKKGTLWRWLRAPGSPNLIADHTPRQLPCTFTNNVRFDFWKCSKPALTLSIRVKNRLFFFFRKTYGKEKLVAQISYVFVLDMIPFLPKYPL